MKLKFSSWDVIFCYRVFKRKSLFLETEHTHKHELFLRDIKIAKPKSVKNKCIVYKIKNDKGYLTVIKAQ